MMLDGSRGSSCFVTRTEARFPRTAGVPLKVDDVTGLMAPLDTAMLYRHELAMLEASERQTKMGSVRRAEHAVILHP